MRKSKTIVTALLLGTIMAGTLALTACGEKTVNVPGKSAYEIAVDNGFKGTEAEWLESLKTPATVIDTKMTYTVNADGKTVATVTMTMSDGSTQTKEIVMPRRVVTAEIQYYNTALIFTSEQAKNKNNLPGLVWYVRYDDGSRGYLPVSESQIFDIRPYSYNNETTTWDGNFEDGKVYEFNVIFSKYWDTNQTVSVYINNNADTIADNNSGELTQLVYQDTVQIGESVLNTMYLYDRYDLTAKLQEKYTDGYGSTYYFSLFKPVTSDMLKAPLDVSTVGNKEFIVVDGQNNYDGNIDVYDPSVSIVEDLYINNFENNFVITVGDNVEEALSSLIGAELNVNYYVTINGRSYETVTVTEDMLDYSEVDSTQPGLYKAFIEYAGSKYEVNVTVNPDMSKAEKQHELTGEGYTILSLYMGAVVTKVDLYDNNYCEVFIRNRHDEIESTVTEFGYVKYKLNGSTLEVEYNGEKIAIFSADLNNNTFSAYEFATADLVATYTCDTIEPVFSLKTYKNGYGELVVEIEEDVTMTLVVGYIINDDVLTLTPTNMGAMFKIEDDNTLTFIDN